MAERIAKGHLRKEPDQRRATVAIARPTKGHRRNEPDQRRGTFASLGLLMNSNILLAARCSSCGRRFHSRFGPSASPTRISALQRRSAQAPRLVIRLVHAPHAFQQKPLG